MPSFCEILDDFLIRYLCYFNYRGYVSRMHLNGNERILEIGSGGGNLSRFIVENLPNGQLVCIDYKEYWIKKAQKRLSRFSNINFELSDFLEFRTKDYSDIAIIHYVLHEIPKEKRKNFVGILNRVLKQKSTIYIREPIRKNSDISSKEIRILMEQGEFSEQGSKEDYSFPIRGRVYEGIYGR